MITIADLDRILAMMQQYGLQTLRVREGDALLALKLAHPSGSPAVAREEHVVRSKAVGRLRFTHPQKQAPEIELGDRIAAGTILGFLENGPVLLPITAGKAGIVLRLEAAEGSLLGYGAAVMTVLVEA